MNDLVEVEYQIGDFRAKLSMLHEKLQPVVDRERILKDELASLQTVLAQYRDAVDAVERAIHELEKLRPKLLSETDAVTVLKAARDQGKFDHDLEQYSTEAKHEHERMIKALYTIGADWYVPNKANGLYCVDIVEMPDSYREFLYGVEVAE